MDWKRWLKHYCPKDWTNENALLFISKDCPEVTLEDIKRNRWIEMDEENYIHIEFSGIFCIF